MPDSLRNLTAHTILGELGQRITRMKELLSSHSAPSAETVDTPPMNCSFAFWSQLQPLPEGTTQEQVDEYEKELQQNSGRDVAHLPRPSINGIAYSQNCGLVLRVKNTSSALAGLVGIYERAYFFLLRLFSLAHGPVLVENTFLQRIHGCCRLHLDRAHRASDGKHQYTQRKWIFPRFHLCPRGRGTGGLRTVFLLVRASLECPTGPSACKAAWTATASSRTSLWPASSTRGPLMRFSCPRSLLL